MRIGNFRVPNNPYRLPRLVGRTKKIYDTYKADTITKATKSDALAQLLGYKSSNNGAYLAELSALKAYGLLEGRSDVRVSGIGKQATYGVGEQKPNALLKAFLNIPLWKTLHDRYRLELPSQDFWAKLQHITGCEAPEAKSNEKFVTEAFYVDANLIKSVKPTPTIGGEDLTKTGTAPKETLPSGEFIEITAGSFYQRLPLSLDSLEVAEAMLKVLKKQLQSQLDVKKEEPHTEEG